jgi:hypothetical protein
MRVGFTQQRRRKEEGFTVRRNEKRRMLFPPTSATATVQDTQEYLRQRGSIIDTIAHHPNDLVGRGILWYTRIYQSRERSHRRYLEAFDMSGLFAGQNLSQNVRLGDAKLEANALAGVSFLRSLTEPMKTYLLSHRTSGAQVVSCKHVHSDASLPEHRYGLRCNKKSGLAGAGQRTS